MATASSALTTLLVQSPLWRLFRQNWLELRKEVGAPDLVGLDGETTPRQ
ncbi:hypothetical protein KZZ52_22995 [Dactylosporangium sp. AC04546]|nr:hypothetical protein [Dactylosporangium sp. AC04546]WVK88145.1 hypothetical protein KZZ52_22995 [Dactylosporangium sp. AC04546]